MSFDIMGNGTGSPRKVAFCVPSLHGPTKPFIAALEQSVPLIEAAGWDASVVEERGCPYISHARATMLRKALDAGADEIVFLDYDLSWDAGDLLKLIQTEGDVVAGLYRFKKEPEEYMGVVKCDGRGVAITREDGAIRGEKIPAGFLKINRPAVDRFMKAYPELTYGVAFNPSTDLFNHGAYEGVWYGEDYSFSRRWLACGGDIWIVPDLNLVHHGAEASFPGNFHQFLMRQPGGSLDASLAIEG